MKRILLLAGILLLVSAGAALASGKAGERVVTLASAPELEVIHLVRNSNLYLEFRLKHFRLSREKMGQKPVYGEGHIHLYLDGRRVAQIFQPVYVHPGLTPGRHTVKVELVHHNHQPYGIQKEFVIEAGNLRETYKDE